MPVYLPGEAEWGVTDWQVGLSITLKLARQSVYVYTIILIYVDDRSIIVHIIVPKLCVSV